MTTIRFNAFVFKALSHTGIQPTILSTRHFARSPSSSTKSSTKFSKSSTKKESKPKKTKRATKKDEKLAKLLKQYPDPQSPKRPSNAYIRFGAEYKKRKGVEISPETMGNVSRSIASAWRTLPDGEKSKFTQAAEVDKKKYKDAKKKYDDSGRAEQWVDKIVKLSQDKPPKSGYQLFMKKRLPQNRDKEPMTPQPQILSMTAHEWSSLGADKKKQWSDKAKASFAEWEAKLK